MHEQAARYVDTQHRQLGAAGVGQGHALNQRCQRRSDRILAGLAYEGLDGIEQRHGNADHLAGLVAKAEHHHPSAAVGEGGQLVGQVAMLRAADLVAHSADLLELEVAILAQVDLLQQLAACS